MKAKTNPHSGTVRLCSFAHMMDKITFQVSSKKLSIYVDNEGVILLDREKGEVTQFITEMLWAEDEFDYKDE